MNKLLLLINHLTGHLITNLSKSHKTFSIVSLERLKDLLTQTFLWQVIGSFNYKIATRKNYKQTSRLCKGFPNSIVSVKIKLYVR